MSVQITKQQAIDAINRYLDCCLKRGTYTDEDEFYHALSYEDCEGDLHWSKTLTLKVLDMLGLGRKAYGEDEAAYNLHLERCHRQLVDMKLL